MKQALTERWADLDEVFLKAHPSVDSDWKTGPLQFTNVARGRPTVSAIPDVILKELDFLMGDFLLGRTMTTSRAETVLLRHVVAHSIHKVY